MPCEKVSLAKKAIEQISHHRKDGVTEAWIESITLNADEEEREYQKNGSFEMVIRTKKPSGAKMTVSIYIREEIFKINDRIIWRTCRIFGIHVAG